MRRSKRSSLSVEQSKFVQQSTMKLGLSATWASVSSMSSRVSPGTGGRRLYALGVAAATGVLGPAALSAASDAEAAPAGAAASAGAPPLTCPSGAWPTAGVLGRETLTPVCCGASRFGTGADEGGVSRSIRYDRKSSSWSLRCGSMVENSVEVVRSDCESSAGESDRVNCASQTYLS